MIDYKKIPEWWPVCPNGNCKLAASCLRQKVCREAPAEMTRWMCVMPSMAVNDNTAEHGGHAACPYYQKEEKVILARGMNRIYDKVRNRHTRCQLRTALTAHLGSRGTYYRYKDGERLIAPDLQQWIQDLFCQHGETDKVLFDEYLETYDFTKVGG